MTQFQAQPHISMIQYHCQLHFIKISENWIDVKTMKQGEVKSWSNLSGYMMRSVTSQIENQTKQSHLITFLPQSSTPSWKTVTRWLINFQLYGSTQASGTEQASSHGTERADLCNHRTSLHFFYNNIKSLEKFQLKGKCQMSLFPKG